ncbi:MAG: hypothetical protein ACTSQJ_13130 [Promethearchaeota archaeon]
MGKKKKKELEPSLEAALKSSKKTESALIGLLNKGKSLLYRRRQEDKKTFEPQLSYESRLSIAEQYAKEDLPLTEWQKPKGWERQKLIERKGVDVSESSVGKQLEELPPGPAAPPIPIAPAKPSTLLKEINIYEKLGQFFNELMDGYSRQYSRWENSISNLLAIMRKMRKITKKNTEDLTVSINNMLEKIQEGLKQFKIKRDEIEKVAGVNIESMSGEFKRVLGLLELQIKEYTLKKVTDELIHEQKLFL